MRGDAGAVATCSVDGPGSSAFAFARRSSERIGDCASSPAVSSVPVSAPITTEIPAMSACSAIGFVPIGQYGWLRLGFCERQRSPHGPPPSTRCAQLAMLQ